MYEILSIRQFSICGAASVLEALDVGISTEFIAAFIFVRIRPLQEWNASWMVIVPDLFWRKMLTAYCVKFIEIDIVSPCPFSLVM